ncbi:MAG: hypothetical protein HY057_00525, partial [Rhodospirillales bacterium]|nr:hypothetical protein [Rhodospirillales bacterium]
ALQLRTALSGSRPYAKEVAAIRAVAGADPALAGPLAVLATHAENGVATVSQLRDSFASFVVPRLAVVASGDGRSLGARAEAWVGSFFSRAATPEERITNIVAQAERNLTHGHLSGAVDHLSQLDAAAAAAAATWMADARARLAVNAALSAVSARALDRFVAAN